MSQTNQELIIPPAAANSPDGREILRAWVVGESLHCSLQPTVWDSPSAWGLVLADVAKHVADANYKEHGLSVQDTLDSIRLIFTAEMLNPTDEAKGTFI